MLFLLLGVKSLSTFGDSLNKHSPSMLFITASFNSYNVIPVTYVNESIHLVLCLPRLLVPSIFPSVTSFSIPQAHTVCITKVRARLTTTPSGEVSGLISSKIDSSFCPRSSLSNLCQHHCSQASNFLLSFFLTVQLSQ